MNKLLWGLGLGVILLLSGCDGLKTHQVIAVDDSAEVTQGDSVVINVLANDKATSTESDVSEDSSDQLGIGDITQPLHGTATKDGKTIVYINDGEDSSAVDSFKYKALIIENNIRFSDEAEVFITIRQDGHQNHTPEANDAIVNLDSCDIGTEIPIQLQANDEDDDSLVYSIDNSGLDYGTVTLTDEDAGTALFTIDDSEAENACFDGMSNSFTFKVNDGTEDSDSATITIVAPEPV